MYHTIEFRKKGRLDLEISAKKHLEKLHVRPGTRMSAQLKPYVIETDQGPVEVADLFFADGTTSRAVFYASFSFVDSPNIDFPTSISAVPRKEIVMTTATSDKTNNPPGNTLPVQVSASQAREEQLAVPHGTPGTPHKDSESSGMFFANVVMIAAVVAVFLFLLWKALGLGAIATVGFLGICFYVSLYCYFIWRTSREK